MKALDPRDNRDIIEKIRRQYLIKGIACAALSLGAAGAFALFGWESFAPRFGTGNAAAAAFLLAVLPFFLLRLHRDIADRSWEGVVLSAKKCIVKKNAKYTTAADKGDPCTDFIKLTVQLPDGDTKTVFRPMDELCLFRKNDRIRHIRGTKHYQLWRPLRNRTDCVMCGHAAESTPHDCPKCGYSLVKFDPPEAV